MTRAEIRAALLRGANGYDCRLGILVQETPETRMYIVPFGLAMRCWPASPDSPVVLHQQRLGDSWYHERAYRLRDDIPVEPPFDSDGRCWTVLPAGTPLEPMEAYAFSTMDTAAAVLSSTPRHLGRGMEVYEAVTTTPWRSPHSAHAIYFPT